MDILIAILWWLNLLIPGQTYNYTDIESIAAENQTAIESVHVDPVQTDVVLNYYDQTFGSGQVGILEEWDENPIKPIRN
jgi:hypothetical protein